MRTKMFGAQRPQAPAGFDSTVRINGLPYTAFAAAQQPRATRPSTRHTPAPASDAYPAHWIRDHKPTTQAPEPLRATGAGVDYPAHWKR